MLCQVSELRTSTGPCGTLSRWKLLDCTAVDCTESSFDTSDRQLLATRRIDYQRGI